MERKGDILYNLLDSETGQWETYEKVTTLPDGTAINDTNIVPLTPIYRKLGSEYFKKSAINVKSVSVKDFGAKGDGLTDDTAAIQAAIDYMNGSPVKPNIISLLSNAGKGELFFPRGKYRINGPLDMDVMVGMKLRGESNFATSLEFHGDTGTMFEVGNFNWLGFEDMVITHVPVNSDKTTWTNTAFNMLEESGGTGGGVGFYMNRVRIEGFNIQFKVNGTVNGDSFNFSHCFFTRGNTHFQNNNPQSVINTWNQCAFHHFEEAIWDLYYVGSYMCNGGNAIIPGDCVRLHSGSTSFGDTAKFTFINFKQEWYNNIVPGSTPKVVNCVDGDDFNCQFEFISSSLRGGEGGQDVSSNVIFTVRGNTSMYFSKCAYREGLWELYRANRLQEDYNNVNKGNILFDATIAPMPSQFILLGSSAQPHARVIWRNCENINDFQLIGAHKRGQFNQYTSEVSLNDSVADRLYAAGGSPTEQQFLCYGEKTRLNAVRVYCGFTSGSDSTVEIFSDASRTNLIGFLNIPSGPGSPLRVFDVIIPKDTVVTEGVFTRVTNPDGDAITGRIEISVTQIGR